MDDRNEIKTSFELTPENPFSMDIPTDKKPSEIAYPGFELEQPAFGRVAYEEFKEQSSTYKYGKRALHELSLLGETPPLTPQSTLSDLFQYAPAPDGWNAKQEIEKQSDIDPKYMPRLLSARSPQDFQYILTDIQEQQDHDETLANGSMTAKVLGGLVGLSPIGSLESMIPIFGMATKMKVGSGFFNAMIKNYPGMLAAGAIREGADQMSKAEFNTTEFIKDTFIDATLGTLIFGGIGAFKSAINVSEFNRLKSFAKATLDGIGFNYVIDQAGNLKGFKAIDTIGNVSAAKLKLAQDLADSSFAKIGLFKIPYVGAASLNLISGNIPGLKYFMGSPLIRLATSKYKSAQIFMNAAFDHTLTTEKELEGGVRTPSFEFKFKQTRAMLSSLQAETNALHAARNGYDLESRPVIGVVNAYNAIKQKTLQSIAKDTDSTNYISREDFMDEVQQVLYSEAKSEHNAVNDAANLYRKVIDDTWKEFREAYNLPEEWLPPRTSAAYLMRVYDTQFMQDNQGAWVTTVSKWLAEADKTIELEMAPVNAAEVNFKNARIAHEDLIKRPGVTNEEIGTSVRSLEKLERAYKKARDDLTNRMRSNPALNLHIEDPSALSANEIKEIKKLNLPVTKLKKEIKKAKAEIAKLKQESFFEKGKATKTRSAEKAKEKIGKAESNQKMIEQKESELKKLEDDLYKEESILQDKMAGGEIKANLYYRVPETNIYKFKDTNERLKFRNVYESDFHREQAAKGYYNSILNLNPQDVISDMFGRMTGKKSENVLKSRTLMIPDEVLYNGGFMTKDLYSKTANYVSFLSRKTHLKNSFRDVTIHGDHNEIASSILDEHLSNRDVINKRLDALKSRLENPEEKDKKAIQKEIDAATKELNKEIADYNNIKKDIKYLFETRMMGINQRDNFTNTMQRVMMSLASAINLHNLPATQITDLAFAGFQHGIWPSIRDGIYPIFESMGGILKTKNAEALREMAPHIHLGFQDMANNYSHRNVFSELNPYINMGKIVSGVEKYSHFSALTDLSPYIDNGIQRVNGSIIQSRFMELLHKQIEGTISDKEALYLRKYGIDPKIWADRMVKAYKSSNGFKTKLGGYMSKSWVWEDVEAANVFNDAVFRGIQNTLVYKGMADTPFFADHILGMFFHTFTGWTYGATNRYLIPALQHADGELVLKTMWMLGAGAMVSPMRRLSRGEDLYPEEMTPLQKAYEAWSDSGVFSSISNVLNLANFLSNDKLLGDLKNDKYRNRVRVGLLGTSDVLTSTANRMADVLSMATSGLHEHGLKNMANMFAITGSMYGHYLSNKLIESWDLPKNRKAAEAQ